MRLLLRFMAIVVVAGVVLALGVGLLARPVRAAFAGGTKSTLPNIDQAAEPSERSYVYAADGSVLAVLHAEENRSPVTLDRVPKVVVDAILDVEDERFWSHGAIDLRSTLRAFATNAESGSVQQGGSTITQQLVKNLLLTPERHVDRKVKEAVLALQVEDKLTKNEILERYLNIVYFGNGAYGVQAAAETYFGVEVDKLGPAEAAFLAGMIRNPVGYDPIQFRELSTARRNQAIDRMVANGHLTTADAERLKTVPLPTSVREASPQKDDYFVEEVKQRLLRDERLGETETERYNAVFRGGLRIYTTLDPRMQHIADDEVRAGVPANKIGATAALVAVEPSSGRVRAMVGGSSFETVKFNLATQGYRQPGSSYKVFTLLAMLEAGYSPTSTVNGTGPCYVPFPNVNPYKPIENSESHEGGTMAVSKATALSVNCAYLRIAATIGLDKTAEMARRFGLGTDPAHPVEELPTMVIGSEEATPLEMASAYATLANDGVYHAPTFIDRVVDRTGKEVFKGGSEGKRLVSSQVSRIAVDVLEDVVTSGTGTRARLSDRPSAGKTGTTDDFTNAWFVGFTPQLATAVWMGAPTGNVPMSNVGGIRVFGGTYPAHIWHEFMAGALTGVPVVKFTPPDPKALGKTASLSGKPGNKGGTTVTTIKRSGSKPVKPKQQPATTVPASSDSGGTDTGGGTGADTGGGGTGADTGGGGTGGAPGAGTVPPP